MGGDATPTASRVVIIACGAAATAEEIGLCALQIRAIENDPNFHGGDYYDRDEGPWRGLSLARGIGQISYRTELELAQRFNRGHQNDEHPFAGGQYTIESYLEYHGEKLARRFDANTYIVLSRVMNHHDVGRGRSGVRRRARSYHRPGHAGRHLLRPPVPDAPPGRAGRADPEQLGCARRRIHLRA